MTSVRINSDRVQALISHNSEEIEKHITTIGQLQNSLVIEEERLRECLLQRQRLESL